MLGGVRRAKLREARQAEVERVAPPGQFEQLPVHRDHRAAPCHVEVAVERALGAARPFRRPSER
eukprot:5590129-Prymnesium_polylepis.1